MIKPKQLFYEKHHTIVYTHRMVYEVFKLKAHQLVG